MSLRRRASAAAAGVAIVASAMLSGCQNPASPQASPTTTPSPLSSLAAKVPERIRSDGVLTIGIDPTYPPMEYLQRGEAIGADLDLMTAVAQQLGLRPQFVEEAYALLVPGVAAGRFDTAISALAVDDRDLQNVNMVTYFEAGTQLAVRPPAKKRFGPRNLCGRKITVLDGSVQHSQLVASSANCTENKKKPIKILTFQQQAPATQAVIDGKAYGTLADSAVIENAVAASDGALVTNGKILQVSQYGIAVASERKQLARVIRLALKEMMEDGTYQQVLEGWHIAGGAISDPHVLTRRDIIEPPPLVPAVTPSTSPSM